jgi:LmbE family N-acetylglucosaminyl deacetylase
VNFIVDANHLGTPESAWAASGRLSCLAPLEWTDARRVVVVAPHPDDEVFGAGGLLHLAQARGMPVEIIAVTDGERSHPEPDFDLRAERAAETAEALSRLGLGQSVRRLGIPDGEVAGHVDILTRAVAQSLRPGDLCVAPWVGDGHPDHDACGRVALAAAAATGARLLGFLVWAWHWADPEGIDLPWVRCRRVALPRRVAARKRWSTGAFASQTRPTRAGDRNSAVLPPSVLHRFYRPFEVFVEEVP